jgi:hypothetical protein
MIQRLILPALLVIFGAFFLVRNLSHLRNKSKLIEYLENSPKGKLWISKVGREKTINLAQKVFLPLGIVLALVILGSGLFSIYSIVTVYCK